MCLTDNIADKHTSLTDNTADKRHAGNNETFIDEQQCAGVKRREADRQTDRQRRTERQRETERDLGTSATGTVYTRIQDSRVLSDSKIKYV